MSQRLLSYLRTFFFSIDLLAINIVYFFSIELLDSRIFQEQNNYYERLWLFTNVAWLLATYISYLYSEQHIAKFENFSKKTLKTYIYFTFLLVLYLFFYKQVDISRLFIISILSFHLGALLFNRILYLMVSIYFRNNKFFIKKVLIVGYNDLAKRLVGHFELQDTNIDIVGFCEDEDNMQELSHYPILSGYNGVIDVSTLHGVNEIYTTIAPETNMSIYNLMQAADQACIRFKVVADLNLFIRKPIYIEYVGNMPVLSLRKEPLNEVSNRIRKRLYDILISSFVTIFILSWLVPLIALLIKLESKGPVFFLQKRSGKDNKPFTLIKFRSMHMTTDAHVKQATKDDSRVTKIGKFLRKTSLDEFPQFLNVLMGQMSIVGPRPHMLKHTQDYSKLLDQYMVRQFLKPGITGWAQINGYRGETKTIKQMEKRVEFDLWYLENWNLWLDSKIVLMTALNMAKGEKNAY
ncbi:MAG TPA: undecaprenyl-phosphate glucose phosphotransferase [Chitinophagaceae bacterium]|nr:undecaprenyl-phosphate glucose phosphotransferase [Chitinophagaceae bacterium]